MKQMAKNITNIIVNAIGEKHVTDGRHLEFKGKQDIQGRKQSSKWIPHAKISIK